MPEHDPVSGFDPERKYPALGSDSQGRFGSTALYGVWRSSRLGFEIAAQNLLCLILAFFKMLAQWLEISAASISVYWLYAFRPRRTRQNALDPVPEHAVINIDR